MTVPRDPEAIVAAWLEDGPVRLPDETRHAIAVSLRTQPRARGWPIPGGIMLSLTRLTALAAGLVAVAVIGVLTLSNRTGSTAGPGSSPSAPVAPASSGPSTSPSASASAGSAAPASVGPLDVSSWTPFSSARYGFSIAHPADWRERPSDHPWALPADANWLSTGSDGFVAPGDAILVTAWSTVVAPGTSLETWIASTYCPAVEPTSAADPAPCDRIGHRSSPEEIDGRPGSLVRWASDTQAFFLVGGRIYVFAVWEEDSDPRTASYGGAAHLLEAFLSTVRLAPPAS